ncbi:MAG: purine-nucleoside phosphorylase [Alphaproteobacteria bacterium]|nr:purine-nucleoside phosphorylase [Alphaproteobacteria bacterium]MBV9418359.1 purine-nucleoside phosphorylase [Alphaproteobacteria bacterium]MBV9540933.1 purine-nucleoside phosphorylase [Alphaproteobacteria bacterium]MBV9904614.1 purine-nucleoside phosphorylase [Alphaproteobacteria bacterium]
MATGADLAAKVEQGVAALTKAVGARPFPKTALVLGSGLGPFADKVTSARDVSYRDIPGFPIPTVVGHSGKLRIGEVSGCSLAVLQGRFHAYEGHPPQEIGVPIRILRRMGVERLFLTNAAGSLRVDRPAGTLMAIEDHINFAGLNPLVGPNDEKIGPRFPDMSHAYDPDLRAKLHAAAEKSGVTLASGVYVFVSGPNFETPAEIRMFGKMGADAVGMSTVPETLAAIHCGMKVIALSVMTNLAAGLSKTPLTHHETLQEAAKAHANVEKLLLQFFAGNHL